MSAHKALKVATRLRSVLAANVRALMLERYPDIGDKVKALAKACGISRSTVQRVVEVNPRFGTNVDTIERIAAALRVASWQLLVENMDAHAPPELRHGRQRRRPSRGSS